MAQIDRKALDVLRPVIEGRLRDFASVPREFWVREVLFCLLTPQSTPFHAEACLCELERKGLFSGCLRLEQIAEEIGNPDRYVRFHREKARRIVEFLDKQDDVKHLLFSGAEPQEERSGLVRLVKGLGFKESSHALRNVGRQNLAILDRHILRNLEKLGVISSVPESMDEKRYREIEGRFLRFAADEGERIDVLDLFFWASETGLLFK